MPQNKNEPLLNKTREALRQMTADLAIAGCPAYLLAKMVEAIDAADNLYNVLTDLTED